MNPMKGNPMGGGNPMARNSKKSYRLHGKSGGNYPRLQNTITHQVRPNTVLGRGAKLRLLPAAACRTQFSLYSAPVIISSFGKQRDALLVVTVPSDQ